MSGDPKPPSDDAVEATKILEDIKASQTEEQFQEFKNSLDPAIITTGQAKGRTTNTMRVFSHKGHLLYVCNKTGDCTYVRDTDVSVRSHMTKHVARGEVRARTGAHADPVKQIETYAKAIIRLAEDARDSASTERWKERALNAEKELREHKRKTEALRKALGNLD